jgi:hypothetical protein
VGFFAMIAAFDAPFSYLAINGEQRIVRIADSSDGRYRAGISEAKCQQLDCTVGTEVVVQRKFGVFQAGEISAFYLEDSAEHVHIEWTGPRELTVTCAPCTKGRYDYSLRNWGGLIFRYDLAPR